MTALTQYERLESPGIWRPAPDAQRREVTVKFREASLVLTDIRSDQPLSHWSLPAVSRRNPGQRPALYAPGDGPDESLEIDDDIMIEAIERVHKIISTRRPHPGRLRGALALGSAVLIVALALFWLPGALIGHAVKVAPNAKRESIGGAVLAELETLTGPTCQNPAGEQVLSRLSRRVLGQSARLEVLPSLVEGVRRLPGNYYIIGHQLVDGPSSADALAGQLLAARLAADENAGGEDPLRAVLDWAGVGASFRLLTTGNLPEGALKGYGQALLETPVPVPDASSLDQAFAKIGLPTRPYLNSLPQDRHPELTVPADWPVEPVLSDAEWVALQSVCGR